MAVTITRTNWIDDDGSGTTGTVLNNAMKTGLYNEIDTALAKVAQLTGGNSFTGNQGINGLLTVSGPGVGAHAFTASASGAVDLIVRNTLAAANGQTRVGVGNDTDPFLTMLASYASNFSGAPFQGPNVSLLFAGGAGGLSIYAAAAIRTYTNGIERTRITPTGEVLVNTTVNTPVAQVMIAVDSVSHPVGLGLTSLNVANNVFYCAFYNSAGATAGYINQSGSTTVSYGTSSDARLKDDDGRATDLSALRGVVVHDFRWKADGIRDRGVFAQEAYEHFPRAIGKGTDDTTDDGVTLARPWMTDYSKFVADLIVGWQQHDAELTQLRAALATLKGSH